MAKSSPKSAPAPRKSRVDLEREEREATLAEERDARRMDKDAALDLAKRICSGGNLSEQLARWAEDTKHYQED